MQSTMFRRVLVGAVFSAASCTTVPLRTAATQAPTALEQMAFTAYIDPLFENLKSENIPGAVFVFVRDGRVLYAKGYGYADVEQRQPFSPELSIFPIASLTKLFTATAVVQLADRGQIGLRQDVNRYLRHVQVPRTYPQPITSQHLLTHTSGLDEIPGRQTDSKTEPMALAEFLRSRLVRVHSPGEVTSYSSYGMTLAGAVIEDVSGTSYESYLAAHIWRPLGMNSTFVRVPADLTSRIAKGYELRNERLVQVEHERYHTVPASSIYSTALDLSRFIMLHLSDGRAHSAGILSPKALRDMHTRHATVHPRIPGWTYGFQENDTNGQRILQHGGDIGGFSVAMVLLPDHKAGFLIATHREGNSFVGKTVQKVLDRYFPEERRTTVPTPRADAKRRAVRFAGTYRWNIFCHSCGNTRPAMPEVKVTANDDGSITLVGYRWIEVAPAFFIRADGKDRLGFCEHGPPGAMHLSGGSWNVYERVGL